MKLTRKLKINDITPVDFSDYEIKVIEFFENIISNYDVYNPEDSRISHNIYLLDVGGNYCFRYDKTTQNFYVRDNWTWESIMKKKIMNLSNLLDYLKWRLAKYLKVKIACITYGSRPNTEVELVEELFKKSDTYLKKREGISKLTYLDFLNNETVS